jgi:hypothetical protein
METLEKIAVFAAVTLMIMFMLYVVNALIIFSI